MRTRVDAAVPADELILQILDPSTLQEGREVPLEHQHALRGEQLDPGVLRRIRSRLD
jgi:hypothetical protein